MQIFRPGANTIAKLLLAASALFRFWPSDLPIKSSGSPYVTGQNVTRDQPVPFSHEHHVGGLGLDCRYCHTSVEKGALRRNAADRNLHDLPFPDLDQCARCWRRCGASLAENKPIRWQRVHSCRTTSTSIIRIHVAKGVGCTTCHGPVDQHEADAAGGAADHGMVPRLPPRPGARTSAAARSRVRSRHWTPPADQREQRRRSCVAAYHIRTDHLTDCSICHR